MLERFVKDARKVAAEAQEEARTLGSSSVEAEHVLLALSRDASGIAGEVLERAGLDYARVLDALESEFERSLMAVGLSVHAFDLPAAAPFAGRPRWGASAKLSLERALEVARARGDRRVESAHILLALLDAEEGTVPRALRDARVDPAALAAEAHAALDRA
jgi:ATP-dependent Clp protease ATP-binding subunit ClpA